MLSWCCVNEQVWHGQVHLRPTVMPLPAAPGLSASVGDAGYCHGTGEGDLRSDHEQQRQNG